jgi:hypothetical protein
VGEASSVEAPLMVVEPVEGRFREGETPVDSGVGGGGSFMA